MLLLYLTSKGWPEEYAMLLLCFYDCTMDICLFLHADVAVW